MIHSLRVGLLLILLSQSSSIYAQPSKDAQPRKEGEISCYKTVIKEPLTFYGNSLDTFTLYDGTKWKVLNGGAYEYIPLRYRDAFICPTEGILVIDKKALSVGKLGT
jgi:hypothetical protein